jgi:putative transposase
MGKPKRVFTPEERLSILQECDREGQSVTIRKYNISPSLIQLWKKKYLAKGIAGLKPSYNRVDPEKRALEEENERLKRIISKQALEIEFKTELLKHAAIDPLKKKK